MRRLLCCTLLLVCVSSILARDADPLAAPDTVSLVDGTVLRGRIVEEYEDRLVIETALGRIDVPREQIDWIEREQPSGRIDFEGRPDPDANTIFLTPTPETKGRGGYFRNFLLFFLNWGYAVHEDVDLSIGTLFPVSTEVYWVSAGFKWRLVSREEYPFGAALLGNFNLLDGETSGSIGGVLGLGNAQRSLNFAVSHFVTEDNLSSTVVLIGGDARIGQRVKFLAEYMTSAEALDEDFGGLINFGFRWFGERMSFSLTGFRPLESGGSFGVFPFTMFSLHF